MDDTIPDFHICENGYCNYCNEFLETRATHAIYEKDLKEKREDFINRMKQDGKGKEYDCVVGVSGGVDSSYALYLAVKNGLRPLAVHLDNGWNSELATHNIANLVQKLKVDLYTHVINWNENRDMQLSFFKADVIDIELLMDNAMLALNYQMAKKYGVKYILSGSNFSTEGMRIPQAWNHNKYDVTNIRSIHKKFGKIPIKTHLLFSSIDKVIYEGLYKIRWLPFLDLFEYNKKNALHILTTEMGYKPYPYKHYESIFTRFYQGYILPRKFNVDKRKVHLSTLILTGQMERANVLELLKESPYPQKETEQEDLIFVTKKLGFTEAEFNDYMSRPPIPHENYGSELWLWKIIKRLSKFVTLKKF
ncbi:MAG: N-acetyl sugar amidotransferase [Chitinophagaceae bacterium]|nr:N-acetyl sugar amidotransferase [Chitinophagaceae bacterium]